MNLRIGQRIELVRMDDPDPIPIGSQGTVRDIQEIDWHRKGQQQVDVAWDNGRTLSLVIPPDEIRVIGD